MENYRNSENKQVWNCLSIRYENWQIFRILQLEKLKNFQNFFNLENYRNSKNKQSSTFERSLIFKLEMLAILKFGCSKFQLSPFRIFVCNIFILTFSGILFKADEFSIILKIFLNIFVRFIFKWLRCFFLLIFFVKKYNKPTIVFFANLFPDVFCITEFESEVKKFLIWQIKDDESKIENEKFKKLVYHLYFGKLKILAQIFIQQLQNIKKKLLAFPKNFECKKYSLFETLDAMP